MFEQESLRLADAYEWLGTGSSVADYLCCNQSTVSRSIRKFRRLENELRKANCIDLLEQERFIHQKWRFMKGSDLRLHAYQWTNHLISSLVPEGWRTNPARVSSTRRDVIELIVHRQIDAACAPYPLIANADKTWIECIPIFRSHLQLFTSKNNHLSLEQNLSQSDIAETTVLQPLDFAPKQASQCSQEIDASLFGSKTGRDNHSRTEPRYWGIPLTPLVAPNLKAVDFASPCPYEEFLVVRKEWAEHSMTTRLLQSVVNAIEHLIITRQEFQPLAIAI